MRRSVVQTNCVNQCCIDKRRCSLGRCRRCIVAAVNAFYIGPVLLVARSRSSEIISEQTCNPRVSLIPFADGIANYENITPSVVTLSRSLRYLNWSRKELAVWIWWYKSKLISSSTDTNAIYFFALIGYTNSLRWNTVLSKYIYIIYNKREQNKCDFFYMRVFCRRSPVHFRWNIGMSLSIYLIQKY